MLKLSETQEADLLGGKLYLNIHSANFAAGELRGQAVTEDKVVLSNVQLLGKQEVLSNNSCASEIMNGVYDKATNRLSYNIAYTGVTPTAMHFHKGAVGVNGGVPLVLHQQCRHYRKRFYPEHHFLLVK